MSKRPALLLIDVQQDFLGHPLLEPTAGELTTRLTELLDWFRRQGWPVLHVHTRVRPDLSNAMPHWQTGGRALCIEGTPGVAPSAPLAPLGDEPVFVKQFYDGFDDPGLAEWLHRSGIDTLVLGGVHTHACVRSTAVSAYAHGLRVLIPTEAVASYDPAHARLTVAWLDQRTALCLPIEEIRQMLSIPSHNTDDATSMWEHRDPTDWRRVLAEVPITPAHDVYAAADRLAIRRDHWARVPHAERIERLKEWHAHLSSDKERWAAALVTDVGKPRRAALGEIAYALSLLDNVCRTAINEEAGDGPLVRYRPLGTVGSITPWNNPFAMPISKIAPALAYGNCVLWKPALPGSMIAKMLLESLTSVGLGEWVELVTGDAATGQAVVEAPGIDAVSFTGSVAVGQTIARRCGALLRPVQAELGGNNACIVLPDADLTSVATALAAEMFSFAGQRCTAICRVIVADSVYPAFTEALCDAVANLRVGAPDDPETHLGPVISKPHQDTLLRLVREAKAAGAQVLAGGTAPADCPEEGCWIAPTVLTDLPDSSPILRDELFGPVIALIKVANLDAALTELNRGEYGLLGALFSHDPAAQVRFMAEAQAGLLLLNEARPAFSANGPFVGWKASAYGPPEHGRWNRDFYTKVQAVYTNPA